MTRDTVHGDVLIIGDGPAALRLAERLHGLEYPGSVTLLGSATGPPHHRSLLTLVLDGSLPPEALEAPVHPGTRMLGGEAAIEVDRESRGVLTASGNLHRYDTLVFATGAKPRIPEIPGARAEAERPGGGATTLNTVEDCARIGPGRVLVLGGGPLGVEAAAALNRSGREVGLVHSGPHLLSGWVDAEAGALVAGRLAASGVAVESGRRVVEVRPGAVLLDDGRTSAWDALVYCVGVTPRVGLARRAGLRVRRGIVVDDRLGTGVPRVHAIGGCAEHAGRVTSSLAEGWEQAETLARLMTGDDDAYRPPPHLGRLRLPELEVAVLGPPPAASSEVPGRGPRHERHEEVGADPPGTERVTFRHPTAGGYASLVVSADGRLRSAVLAGLPGAIATLGQLHDSGRPLPADRLALLLDREPRGSGETMELPAGSVICRCANVTKGALTRAWRRGARSASALAGITRAGTGCGGCADHIRQVCAGLAGAGPENASGKPGKESR